LDVGQRGSLAWVKSARLKIGIDVLADRYADEFSDDIDFEGDQTRGMFYREFQSRRTCDQHRAAET
jgi:hypothetical protein